MGHTGAVWCVDADCILVFPLSLMFSGSANNGEAVDLEIGIRDAIVYPENDTSQCVHCLGEHLRQVPVLNEEVRMLCGKRERRALWG